MKICRYCKHYNYEANCTKTVVEGIDIVTGRKTSTEPSPCFIERTEGMFWAWFYGSCGEAGRFWEAKA